MSENINGHTNIYGVLGYPARHSFSPMIHNFLFKKYSINSVYLAFEIRPENFKNCISCFKMLQFKGFNVTMPFKEEIIHYLDDISKEAKIIGSVNTVIKKGKTYRGFNTDIIGFMKSLEEKNFDFKNNCALVLGAGGAARSTVLGLINKNINKLYIFNRTRSKAIELVKLFKTYSDKEIIIFDSLDALSDKKLKNIGLIVNCTSVGMSGLDNPKDMLVPEKWDLKDKFIFEMIYNPIETKLILKAKSDKALIINGIDMLINQALSSFEIWNGFYPDKKELVKYFKNSIK
ncbi:MAG: shikimate dehydrogenase [Actinomycetota bacterium]|jgi:shikimate dehydrogenase|nr:shikimate dehydrogenase [Actinomycetota bacterium]